MSETGKLIVLSDLHLWGPQDPLYRALLQFLNSKTQNGDKLFIVGDLFDLFIGNKSIFRERYFELIQAILDLGKKSVEVFYIEGNHDFHLESVFEECAHVRLYADNLHYEWNGKNFYFCHGDKINWRDIGYQFFRFLTRNIFGQCILETTPGTLVDRVGRFMANASRGYHTETPDMIIKLFRNYACQKISNGYDFVIMGHSHYLDNIRFRIESHEGQYINVGYPRKDKKYFEMQQEDNYFELKTLEDFVVPTKPSRLSLVR